MPTNKDFKRVVRARMRKTGESYTAARAQLLRSTPSRAPAAPAAVTPANYALAAGISDAALKKATGCSWERWVKALDHDEAYAWSHARIAKHVREKYKTPSWWTQMVTVGYERIKGLRARGQQRSGSFQASRSKTIHASLASLYRAFDDDTLRGEWLPRIDFDVKRRTKNKSMRLSVSDGTSVVLGFYAKGPDKSQVTIQHEKLPSAAEAASRKRFWGARLDALSRLLTST